MNFVIEALLEILIRKGIISELEFKRELKKRQLKMIEDLDKLTRCSPIKRNEEILKELKIKE